MWDHLPLLTYFHSAISVSGALISVFILVILRHARGLLGPINTQLLRPSLQPIESRGSVSSLNSSLVGKADFVGYSVRLCQFCQTLSISQSNLIYTHSVSLNPVFLISCQ